MDLTTRIFRDLADLANWAFQAAECEPGAYKLAEVSKNKGGKFNIDKYALQTLSLPECATWQDESEYIVKLSYNGGMQVYTFAIGNVFDLLAKFKKIATEDITAKERTQLTTMVKQGEQPGELVAIVELPKSLTKQVAKAANKDKYQARFSGLFIDEGGYIMATDGYIINVCKAVVSSDIELGAFSLPIDFAKRHDGDTVEIYRRIYTYFAKSGEDVVECNDDRRPNYSRCFPHVSEKGRIELRASDLIKSLKRMEGTVTLSSTSGQLSVASSIGQASIPGTCQSDFASKYEIERLSQIVPACSVAYLTTSSNATIFIGSGVMSAVMPSPNDTSYDFVADEQDRTDAFSLMETLEPQPKTKRKTARQQPASEPVQATEEKPTETQTKHRQHAEIKAERPDCLCLINDGCSYHTFGADAEKVGGMFGIEVTNGGIKFPNTDKNLAMLVLAGCRVCVIGYGAEPPQSPETPQVVECTADTSKEPEKQTESICTVIQIPIARGFKQAIMQRVCEHLATPSRKSQKHLQPERLQHSGLLRRKTFRRLRVQSCFVVRWIVGRTYAENAAERKGTGKFLCWNGCKYRQFTRGSTWTRGMNGMTGGANENISNIINKQYHGEMFCRGG